MGAVRPDDADDAISLGSETSSEEPVEQMFDVAIPSRPWIVHIPEKNRVYIVCYIQYWSVFKFEVVDETILKITKKEKPPMQSELAILAKIDPDYFSESRIFPQTHTVYLNLPVPVQGGAPLHEKGVDNFYFFYYDVKAKAELLEFE